MISLKNINIKQISCCIAVIILIIFSNPQPLLFLIGVMIILPGEAIRIWAAGYLQKDKSLTTSGPYAYLSNPLYLGTLLVMIGACICANNFFMLAGGLAFFFFYYFPYKLRKEGNRLKKIFGEEYIEYVKHVPPLIPRLTPYRKEGTKLKKWSFQQVKNNSEHLTFLVILAGIILISRNLWLR